MHLSFGDKAHILTSSFLLWAGGFFLLVGSILCCAFVPQSDFDSLRFYFEPIAVTTGYAAGSEETNCSDNEVTILALLYRFKVNNQLLYGRSYSSEIAVKPGEKVQVEYIVAQPAYSRIEGTRNAPYALWTACFVCLFPAMGAGALYKSLYHSRKTFAIIANACAVTGNYEKARTTTHESDGSTFYRMVYSYEFDEQVYAHTVEANSLSQYNEKEVLVIQHSKPGKAILAKELPETIRERLMKSINA